MVDFQIQDITIWMIILLVFNYLIVYRKNKFLGSLGYMLFGLLMFGIRTEFGYTQEIYGYIALFVFLGGLINLIYETVAKWSGSTKPMNRWQK